MPLGIFPGGSFQLSNGIVKNETTIHFGITRPGIAREIVDVALARDYADTEIENLVHSLRQEWKNFE